MKLEIKEQQSHTRAHMKLEIKEQQSHTRAHIKQEMKEQQRNGERVFSPERPTGASKETY
jgi:hypothetical protein